MITTNKLVKMDLKKAEKELKELHINCLLMVEDSKQATDLIIASKYRKDIGNLFDSYMHQLMLESQELIIEQYKDIVLFHGSEKDNRLNNIRKSQSIISTMHYEFMIECLTELEDHKIIENM